MIITFTLLMSYHIKSSGIFIVIPAYNEDEILTKVIYDLLNYNYNIIVIDDGSLNGIEKLLAKLPVFLITHCINLGQGAALQTGIEFAISRGAEYIVTFDADGQHQASDIDQLINVQIDSNSDIVLGSRFLAIPANGIPNKRKLLLQIGRYFNFLTTGLFLSDAHNGLRAMTRKTAQQLKLKENRMAHATEILSFIKKNRLKYKETAVNVKYTPYSKQKGQGLFSGFRIIFDILLNKIFE
jgi:polyprenyl-phospho-N-acetylgalactosaminyl synthase